MINLAWGGLVNGQIDTSILVDVSGRGDYLESTAAANFLRMRTDLHAATGVWINPAPGSSAYRPEAIQDQFYDAYLAGTGNVAAVPVNRGGQGSNHGWARAVDITGYEGNTAWRSPSTGKTYYVNLTIWNWLLANAATYGYSWGTGDASGEAWHWESLTAPGTTTTAGLNSTPLENDLTPDEHDALMFLKAAVLTGGTSMPDQGRSIGQSLAGIVQVVDRIDARTATPVTRTVNGKTVTISQIQDNADSNTMLRTLTAQIGALQSAVLSIATGTGADPAAITAAAKAGAEQALANLTLKAAG